jgi:hypothetical protein
MNPKTEKIIINSNNLKIDKIMKKFVFAAIAAMVMVSVSNVFASSKMMIDNSEVVPVDTVAPETPKDSAEISTPVLPQAGAEDSTEQATPAETTVESVETTQSEQPTEVQETPQKNAQQQSTETRQAIEQAAVSE